MQRISRAQVSSHWHLVSAGVCASKHACACLLLRVHVCACVCVRTLVCVCVCVCAPSKSLCVLRSQLPEAASVCKDKALLMVACT